MSPFFLRLLIFFSPRILFPVILFGLLAWWLVDGYVEAIARGIHFTGTWAQLDGLFQNLILDRGARAVWLWATLPVYIGWMIAGKAAKKIERFTG